MINKAPANEYHPFYETYVKLVPEGDLVAHLERQTKETADFLSSITEEKSDTAYAEGKWTIKELINHINDAERVFSYRAAVIARGDTQALPGMDQDIYQGNAKSGDRTFASIIEEFEAIRQSTQALFRYMTDADSQLVGNASGFDITPRGLASIIYGHCAHHMSVLKERYL